MRFTRSSRSSDQQRVMGGCGPHRREEGRETIRNLRVAEVVQQDLDLDDAGGATFRTKLRISFKYDDG